MFMLSLSTNTNYMPMQQNRQNVRQNNANTHYICHFVSLYGYLLTFRQSNSQTTLRKHQKHNYFTNDDSLLLHVARLKVISQKKRHKSLVGN